MALYNVEKLNFKYPSQNENVLCDINCSFNKGEFIVICGASGSGKTTFLRHLKKELMPIGIRNGVIYYNGKNLVDFTDKESVCEIGMVFQDPESQIVMDNVINEICFSMENIGIDRDEIMTKVAEITSYFGIEDLLHRNANELSGGQKQMVNICSILALEPNVLLLDEATAQLDPMATKELVNMIASLNKEMNMTIILNAHILDDLIDLADKVIFIHEGKIKYNHTPQDFFTEVMFNNEDEIREYVPDINKLAYLLKNKDEHLPISTRDTRKFIENNTEKISYHQKDTIKKEDDIILNLKKIAFTYSLNLGLIFENLSLSIYKNDFLSILGANGSGKTTLLRIIGDLIKINKGKITWENRNLKHSKNHQYRSKVGYVCQNSMLHFTNDTVREELDFVSNGDYKNNKWVNKLVQLFKLKNVLHHHPYDISGGQKQKLTIIMALAKTPEILLLDEPTKGLDPISKRELGKLLLQLNSEGIIIIMVSHDLDFVAKHSKRAVMLFDKNIVFDGTPRELFIKNNYYTTKINKIMKTIKPEIIRLKDIQYD